MQPGVLCELELGVILRRRCPEVAATQCQSCGKRVCSMHQRPHTASGQAPVAWCVDCIRKHVRPQAAAAPEQRQAHEPYHDPYPSALGVMSDPGTFSSTPESFTGGGGQFGGAGASGSWDDAAGFSAADYAAFDRTIEADRHDARGSYDS